MIEPSVIPDGPKIRSLRVERKWSQEFLAEKARCSKRSVENAESGKRVKEFILAAIAGALGELPERLRIADIPAEHNGDATHRVAHVFQQEVEEDEPIPSEDSQFIEWVRRAKARPRRSRGTTETGLLLFESMAELRNPEVTSQLDEYGIDVLDTCECQLRSRNGELVLDHCYASAEVADEVASLKKKDLVEVTLECIGVINDKVYYGSLMETVIVPVTRVGFTIRRLTRRCT